jgi:hypothetical protein
MVTKRKFRDKVPANVGVRQVTDLPIVPRQGPRGVPPTACPNTVLGFFSALIPV